MATTFHNFQRLYLASSRVLPYTFIDTCPKVTRQIFRSLENKSVTLVSRNFHYSAVHLRMTKASGNRLNWDLTAELIEKSVDELISKNKSVYDAVGAVGAVSADDVTFDNVLKVC